MDPQSVSRESGSETCLERWRQNWKRRRQIEKVGARCNMGDGGAGAAVDAGIRWADDAWEPDWIRVRLERQQWPEG